MNKTQVVCQRRGQSLILVFLVLIALAGVLALTLDFGFVVLARRQMQTAVDSAAMEGLRDVDLDEDGIGDGRLNARQLIQNVFDDDLDPTQNNTTIGAGVSTDLVQGSGYRQTVLGDGSGTANILANRSQYIYRPDPQLNESNEPHGDLVTGLYDRESVEHAEFSDYSRSDFLSAEPGDTNADSFLVRLRRTHNPNGLDRVSGVSSGGGGLPLLVGRLAWFSQRPAGSDYSIRRDGVTVRATTISANRFAVKVGRAGSNDQIYGAIPFGITKSNFVTQSDLSSFILPTTTTLTRFGEVASFVGAGSFNNQVGYVAVIDESLSPNRVIGFWLAASGDVPVRQPNASCRLHDAWSELSELSEQERQQLVTSRNQADSDSLFSLLKSPALVRSVR